MSKDYYAVLGLARSADDVVVHAAWKALLRKYHPDANADSTAQARARDINEAFAVLGKPASRATYDRNSTPNRPPPNTSQRPGQPRAGQSHPGQSHPGQPNGAPRGSGQYYQSAARAAPPRTASNRARTRGEIAAILLLFIALPLAVVALIRYPDALPELGDQLRSYADIGTSSAIILPASVDDGPIAGGSSDGTVPPPIDPAIITAAVKRADRLLAARGIAGAIASSRACDAAVKSVTALDDCAAFNIAVLLSQASTPGAMVRPDPYFTLALERDAVRSDRLDSDPARAAARLATIRQMVIPQAVSLVIARLERRAGRVQSGATGGSARAQEALGIDARSGAALSGDAGPIAALDPRETP